MAGISADGATELPDAPTPAFAYAEPAAMESSSRAPEFVFADAAADPFTSVVSPESAERVPLNQCPYDKTHARECRVHWGPLLISAALYNAFQDLGNLYTGYWYRYETGTGKWWKLYIQAASNWRWNVWNDNNPGLDQYVGHPLMGSITNYIWIQNDPKGATVEFGPTKEYWRSRLRAMVFSTAFSFAWKLGPLGEAGVGHDGAYYNNDNGARHTNETGWVELVTTPIGGLLWTNAEDYMDKHVVKKIQEKPRRPATLLLVSMLTPSRATANIFRFRPPWYRDGRAVKARTFWSDPPEPEVASAGPGEGKPEDPSADPPDTNPASGVAPQHNTNAVPVWPHPGGVHEFGAWWGLSLISGHIWGYAGDVKYMPIDVNYSYLFHRGEKWNLRYAPELTALAMLDEPVPNGKDRFSLRKRTYGSGVSPVGFRASFLPESRVQPFFSTNGGFIYFTDRVLSPQGSQFMYTVDFGGGIQIHRSNRQSTTIGYRYQHLSNANISHHNPGTDTNVFYLAVSRFRTKGYR